MQKEQELISDKTAVSFDLSGVVNKGLSVKKKNNICAKMEGSREGVFLFNFKDPVNDDSPLLESELKKLEIK